jgi:hypothetical protein
MRGLDPRIHDKLPTAQDFWSKLWMRRMDCRVKPGNDLAEVRGQPQTHVYAWLDRRKILCI